MYLPPVLKTNYFLFTHLNGSFNYGALFVDHKIFECAQLIIYLRIFVEALLYHLIKCVDPVLIILFTRLLMQMQMQENQNY